jgi:carbamoyl-phosphate synthase large subunit
MELDGHIVGIDASCFAPAAYLVDEFIQVSRCDAPDFFETTLDLCKKKKISLVVPTIDTELPLYAAHREDFASVGTTVAISAPDTVEICADKRKSHAWLVQNGFPTVRQGCAQEVLAHPSDWSFPLIAKPCRGSASIGVLIVDSIDGLANLSKESNDLVIEEMARGDEHTVNLFVDRSGQCTCAVPHRRMEVRAGEVSKGATVKHLGMMELVSRVAEQLPGSRGPLNVQGFLAPDSDFRITEINARFGGGYPLAYEAGADFPRWLLEESLGRPSSPSFDGWEDGLTMLRYDVAVFLSAKELTNSCP